MLICHCYAVYDSEVESAIAAGATTVDDIADATDAGAGCGGCHLALCARLSPHGSGACGGDDCLGGRSRLAASGRMPVTV